MQRCTTAIVLASVCMLAPARAADRLFAVAAGPAAGALPEFARQGDLRLLANGADLAGIRTNAVQGNFAPAVALERLLAGTGLAARVEANGTILVQKALAPAVPPAPPAPMARVVVPGLRLSQQTAIERKKFAATALDAVVADDVGAFPDRNAAEAISRIAGITLERAEYGEGTTINVRGATARQTRIEIDGLGVQAAGGTDLNTSGGGRGVELRELSTDLIKSIDVVKGATADMSEGSLGGSILIRSRTGLDFDRTFIAARVAAQGNSINRQWAPNLNFILADRMLDQRLGVIVNLTTSEAHNENHTMTVSGVDAGMARSIDFDQSPEKTFAYQPATVSATDPAAQAPLASWAKVGGGTIDAYSPLDIVTRSAAAATKADCYAAFPLYSTAQLALIAAPASRAAAQSQRAGELQSCLNQWNDYTPRNLRYQMRREHDRRQYGDVRLDFKVTDQLTVFAKFNRNVRTIDDQQLFFNQGAISINPDGAYVDSGSAPALVRTPVARSGYYFYPSPSNTGTSGSRYLGLTNGSVVNIAPASVVVDANHHVTQYTLSNGSVNSDQLVDQIDSSSRYAQAGASWRAGPWRADVMAGHVAARATRMQWRTNFGFATGPTTVTLAPDGFWTTAQPAGQAYDQHAVGNYGTLAAPAAVGLPALGPATQLTLANPRLMERTEDTARADLAYALDARIPFLSHIRVGANLRRYTMANWNGAGYTAQSGGGQASVVVPRVAQSSSFRACENTAASLATGGTPCLYGTSYSSNPATAFNSSIVMTQAAYRAIAAQALTRDTLTFFNSLPNRPAALLQGWTEIDVRQVIAQTGVQHFNLDCIQSCMGTDGLVHAQPMSGVRERSLATYVSADFAVDRLPFGGELEGNFGWRIVHTGVAATGLMTFASIGASGSTNATLTRNTTLARDTLDVMPMLNLAWWPVRDLVAVRLSMAKAIARPPVEYLYSSGVTCSYDQRNLGDVNGANMSCDGTVGNPALRAMTNRNANLAAEWYASRDTLLSVSGFRQHGIVGAAQRVAVIDAHPFAGTGAADPATGADLAQVAYSYATYANGPATDRRGVELNLKQAFTRLPWRLRYTGVDANLTLVRSKNLDGPVRDLLTGAEMAPVNETSNTWNASLWYDDGKLRARVALQGAAAYFRGLPASVNNYPATGVTGTTSLPLNPGSPTYRDATRYLDAKVSWRFDNGIELFAEGRNLLRAAATISQTTSLPLAAGTPNLVDYGYYGAQYMVGLTVRR